MRRSPRFARLRVVALALLVATGCSTSWAPSESRRAAPPGSPSGTESETALQWPEAPSPAKLTFVRSLTGFAPQPGATSAWRRFVYGRGPTEENVFVLPTAVATARDGRIAVADLGRAAVHLFVPAEQRYQRLTGTGERALVSPVGLAFDDASRLFVTDSTGALHAFDAQGLPLFVRTSAGPADRPGAGGGEGLQRPTGLAYSPTTNLLYVVDTLASRVHAFAPDGEWRFSFGRRGGGDGELNFPTHLFRSPAGKLYVADSLNFRVAIFDEDGAPLGAFGRHGDGSGDLAMPKGVAVDADGVVYVADSMFDNLQLFHDDGAYLLTLGGRGTGFGEFWLPSGLFVARSGAGAELYVCDTYNHRVQVFAIRERYAPATS